MLCKRISLYCVKVYWTLKYHKWFLKMGTSYTWNIEINILVCENEMFSLPTKFHFNNDVKFNSNVINEDTFYYNDFKTFAIIL